MPLSYPKTFSDRQRISIEEAIIENPYKTLYFEFDHRLNNTGKVLKILPKNSLIWAGVIINIIDKFNGMLPRIELGKPGNPTSIGFAIINTLGPRTLDIRNSVDFLSILTSPYILLLSLTHSITISTRGRGWGLVHYLDMDLVGDKNAS